MPPCVGARLVHRHVLVPHWCTTISWCQIGAPPCVGARLVHHYVLVPDWCTAMCWCHIGAPPLVGARLVHRHMLVPDWCTTMCWCQIGAPPCVGDRLVQCRVLVPEKCTHMKGFHCVSGDVPVNIQHISGEGLHGNNVSINNIKVLHFASFFGGPHKPRIP